MSEESQRKKEPRVFEGWEEYLLVERYSTGVPLLKPFKPINPPDETAKYAGKDSSRRLAKDEIALLTNSKRLTLLVSSFITAGGITCIAFGIISLMLAVELGSPWPQTNANSLILGSIELIIFGLLLSVVFTVIAVRSHRAIKMLKAMDVSLIEDE